MKPDLYAKAVLTVIAIVLTVIASNQYAIPTATAQAQGPFAGVQFFFEPAGKFTAVDTRSGEYWVYNSATAVNGIFTHVLAEKGKIGKMGQPTMQALLCNPQTGTECADKLGR